VSFSLESRTTGKTHNASDQGSKKFNKIEELPQNFRRHMAGMNHLLHSGPPIMKRHRTQFNRPDDLQPGICAPLH